ncbi:MAG: hypothetical protein VZR00_12315 [Lachnospiraceae bacterium]|jgi:hypothetical protein|nr:hypothetical protein [Lachnospiraceae bacterium]MEE3462640.1 hypothetical protein [Lachnospiraceae bacterium]
MFGKNKYTKELDSIWTQMEIDCNNNYKDNAQAGLKEYSEKLEELHSQGLIKEDYYRKCAAKLDSKKVEMTGYDHKQHIGW